MGDKMSPVPGKFVSGYDYYRRKKSSARSGKLEIHDRRLNPVGRHGYGKDIRKKGQFFGEYSTIPVKAYRRRNGSYVRSAIRRRR